MRKLNPNQSSVKLTVLREKTNNSSLFSSDRVRPSSNWSSLRNAESSRKIELSTIPNASSCELTPSSQILSPQNSLLCSAKVKPSGFASQRTLPFNSTVHKVQRHHQCFSSKSILAEDSEEEKDTLRRTDTSQHSTNSRRSSQKIHQFSILKLLGKGKFGSVYLAIHKLTGFIGALKVIEKSALWKTPAQHRQKMMTQMINQIKIQAFCQHPNIIQLFDFFNDDDRIYLFMELGTDGHLFDMLTVKGKFEEETTSVVAREIVQGIKYMHSKRIIHRDIKLENIVFTFGMAKICDFGWSIYEPKEFRSTICGTPLYLSPEALVGKKYNQKIDIWAIGTLCHEMATGKNPFGIKNHHELSKIVKDDFQMKRGSPELKSFITFILRKDPSHRPSGEVLLKHPFITKYGDIQTADEICNLVVSSNTMIF